MEALKSLKILQIVGYKNSGKTTVIKNWIESCLKENEEVAVIKHHGHANGLMMPPKNTDSMIYFEAGAVSSVVSDHATVQLYQRYKYWSLENSITLARMSNPSILLIEGFKEADYPKVLLLKNEDEWQTLKNLTNIVLVLYHGNISIQNYPSMSIHQTNEINNWLKHWVRGE